MTRYEVIKMIKINIENSEKHSLEIPDKTYEGVCVYCRNKIKFTAVTTKCPYCDNLVRNNHLDIYKLNYSGWMDYLAYLYENEMDLDRDELRYLIDYLTL